MSAKSLANLRPLGAHGRKGIPNKATRELKTILDKLLFKRPEYWKNLVKRIEAGGADQQEKYLMEKRYGRARTEEDELPFLASGDSGPQIIINLPRPPGQLAGRTVVMGAVRLEHEDRDDG